MWHNVKQRGHVWFFVKPTKFSNLGTLLNKVCDTDKYTRRVWETSGKSARLGPDILGEWQ